MKIFVLLSEEEEQKKEAKRQTEPRIEGIL